jgi:hypothetical protein
VTNLIIDTIGLKILKLAGLYRYFPRRGFDSCGLRGFGREADTLCGMGFLFAARSGEYLALSQKGYALLREYGCPFAMPSKRAYSGSRFLERRMQTARIMLACLRAGIGVLPDGALDLGKPQSFVPAFMMRGSGNAGGTNLMNAASCAGFGRFGDAAHMFVYAGRESGGMYLANELSHLHNLSSAFGAGPRAPSAMIFAGESYGEVYARVQNGIAGKRKNPKGRVDFREVYERAETPISLLSCDETGALQLAVMSNPGHRAKIARAAFGERWAPVDAEIPEADGAVRGIPLIVGVDMDVRRAVKVWESARRLGRKEVMLAALPAQIKSFYLSVLPECGLVTPLSIENDLLKVAFGSGFSLYEPQALPAKDGKGGFIRV